MAAAGNGTDAIITGLGVAGVIAAINAVHMPSVAASRASSAGNQHIEAARKSSAWIGAAVVIGASLLARAGGGSTGFASTVFIIGGAAVVGLDVAHRLANATDNRTGKLVTSSMDATAAGQPGSGS
jgi:hypothetical protein